MKAFRIARSDEQNILFEGFNLPVEFNKQVASKIRSLKRISVIAYALKYLREKLFLSRHYKLSQDQVISLLSAEVRQAISFAKEDVDVQFQCSYDISEYAFRLFTGMRIETSTGWLQSESVILRLTNDKYALWLPRQ